MQKKRLNSLTDRHLELNFVDYIFEFLIINIIIELLYYIYSFIFISVFKSFSTFKTKVCEKMKKKSTF